MKQRALFEKVLFGAGLALFPMAAFAATTIGDVLSQVKALMDLFIPIFIGLGLLYFLYGLTEYILASEEGGKAEGRNRIVYGIVGLFVMVAVWGLVSVLSSTFGVSGGNINTLPGVPCTSQGVVIPCPPAR